MESINKATKFNANPDNNTKNGSSGEGKEGEHKEKKAMDLLKQMFKKTGEEENVIEVKNDEEVNEEVDSDNDDEDDIIEDLLQPKNKFLLTFRKEQSPILFEYMRDLSNKGSYQTKYFVFGILTYHIFQTFISIAIKEFLYYYLAIFLLRGIFELLLIVALFSIIHKIYRMVLFKYLLLFIFTCGLFISTFQSICMKVEEMKTIQLIEIILIYIGITNIRFK